MVCGVTPPPPLRLPSQSASEGSGRVTSHVARRPSRAGERKGKKKNRQQVKRRVFHSPSSRFGLHFLQTPDIRLTLHASSHPQRSRRRGALLVFVAAPS